MALTSGSVAVLTTATLIYTATAAATVRVAVDGPVPVCLGPVGVTLATGYPVAPGGKDSPDRTFNVAAGASLYAIARETGGNVRYLANE